MIHVQDLGYSYPSGEFAVRDVEFEVNKGEIFGFLGPNGSGKSTVQKILTGVLRGHTGNVCVFGQDITEVYPPSFYERIGVLFEYPYLYKNLSGFDNLNYFASFYPKKSRRDPHALLEKIGFKMDYIHKPVSTYSKGMRQRINMARSLIHSPELWFLDEPTSGLDPSGAVLFRKIIEEERKKGTTIFLTTHNMMDADVLCDRVAFIVDGSIVVIDTPDRLKKKNSNQEVVVDYVLDAVHKTKAIKMTEMVRGFSFPFDEILDIQMRTSTLEEVFIQCTGKELYV